MIWTGKSPFTVGLTDEHGNVIESFTAEPGQIIPDRWMQVIRDSKKYLFEIDDKGKYDPSLVKQEVIKNWKP